MSAYFTKYFETHRPKQRVYGLLPEASGLDTGAEESCSFAFKHPEARGPAPPLAPPSCAPQREEESPLSSSALLPRLLDYSSSSSHRRRLLASHRLLLGATHPAAQRGAGPLPQVPPPAGPMSEGDEAAVKAVGQLFADCVDMTALLQALLARLRRFTPPCFTPPLHTSTASHRFTPPSLRFHACYRSAHRRISPATLAPPRLSPPLPPLRQDLDAACKSPDAYTNKLVCFAGTDAA